MKRYDIERINAICILTVALDLGLSVKRIGTKYAVCCPWHDDRHPSLFLYNSAHENHCHCFSCGCDHTVIDLVMQTQHWDFKTACEYLSSKYSILMIDEQGQCAKVRINHLPQLIAPVTAPPPLCSIPDEYVSCCHSKNSGFYDWLKNHVENEALLNRQFDAYQLGATRDGGVIFWEIDAKNGVRSGKVMHFKSDGHRYKDNYEYRKARGVAADRADVRANDWVHAILLRQGKLPESWQLTQCLFGEHLLPLRPDAIVMVVESEKSAVFMACFYPQYIWVATGGCSGLTEEKVKALRGREVVFFPDSGKYDEWREKLASMPAAKEMQYKISKALEVYPTNTDLVDVQLGEADSFDLKPLDVCPF